MFLKNLVVKQGGRYFDPAVRNAKLDEHEDLATASSFLSGVLVQHRNEVMHGRDVGYGKAKLLSIQALLVLAVLSAGFKSSRVRKVSSRSRKPNL
jgi:hypothetical protein